MKLNFYEEINETGFKRKFHPSWCEQNYRKLICETKKSIIYLVNNHSTDVNDHASFIHLLFELNAFMFMNSDSYFFDFFRENYINQTLEILLNHTIKLDESCFEKLFQVFLKQKIYFLVS